MIMIVLSLMGTTHKTGRSLIELVDVLNFFFNHILLVCLFYFVLFFFVFLGDSYSGTETEYTMTAFNSLDMTGKVRMLFTVISIYRQTSLTTELPRNRSYHETS